MTRVIVIVQGGVVQAVVTSDPDAVSAAVLDYDNWECIHGDGSHYTGCPFHTPDEVAAYRTLVAEANGLKEIY